MVVRSRSQLQIDSPQSYEWHSAVLGRSVLECGEKSTKTQSVVSEVKHYPLSSTVQRLNLLDDLSGGVVVSEQALRIVIDGTTWGISSENHIIDAQMFPSRRHVLVLTPNAMEVVQLKKSGDGELELLNHGGPRKWSGLTALALTPMGKELIFAFATHPNGERNNAVHQINTFVFKDPYQPLHRWDGEDLEYSSQVTSLRCTSYPKRLLAIGHASGKVEIREMARAGILGEELASHRFEERGAITSMAFYKDRLFVGNCHGDVHELYLGAKRDGIRSLSCISLPFESSSPDAIRAMHYVPEVQQLVVWGGRRDTQ